MSWPRFYRDVLAEKLSLVPEKRFVLLNKCSYPQGPSQAKIAFVGEAPGQNEERFRDVFSGAAGRELSRMLAEAGIDRNECLLTNVFMERPTGNDWSTFFVPDKHPQAWNGLPLVNSKRLSTEHAWHIERLKLELEHCNPNLIVAFGNIPTWALCYRWGISKVRGTITHAVLVPGKKLLPTFHPAYILRNWDDRVLVIADLIKAERQSHFPEVVYPRREVWIEPTLEDILVFHDKYISGCSILALDIETERKADGSATISCISLSPDPQHSIVIPFLGAQNKSYWAPSDEIEVMGYLHTVLGPGTPWKKLGQNGIFDIQYLLTEFGLQVHGYDCDTMILHHAWQPEMAKGLDFLGAAFTDERAWKWLRPRGKREKKKDE